MDLTTRYLGLELRNPLIVGASPLTKSVDSVRDCAKAGAGAVVLRSLFEEQIRAENQGVDDALNSETSWHTEAYEYMQAQIGLRYGTREYLQMLRDSKNAVDIPVIASVNCISPEWWQDFAQEAEAAGADALELNIAIMPMDLRRTDADVEAEYHAIIENTVRAVSIPVSIKLPPYFTALGTTILAQRQAGAAGFVLFNRLYRPTVCINDMSLTVREQDRYSRPGELSPALRWLSLVCGRVDADFAANTGVHSGEDVIRALLVGAQTVQCVTTFLQNGLAQLNNMLTDLETWMGQHNMESLDDFRGRLSQVNNPDTALFGRTQYIEGLVGATD
ncbi:MAG: dihydroorotate dehydrogenase-like protein [Verrucomicrobiota bacterium]